jgi:glycosyltransferase involved in cell wall biosynthesis
VLFLSELVSIIVPIYNGERYLRECIDSIIMQTYHNIEIILVNDGSTDNSKYICEEYKRKDRRILLINQENKGVSEARNNGIIMSKGLYIEFVDCDDWLELNAVERLYNAISSTKSDLVVCGITEVDNSGSINCKGMTKEICTSMNEEIFHLLYSERLLNSPFNKLYTKKLICKMFDVNLSMGEDLVFNLNYLRNMSGRLSIITDYLYRYRRDNSNSACYKYRRNMYSMQKIIFEETYKYMSESEFRDTEYVDRDFLDKIIFLVIKRIIKQKISKRKKIEVVREVVTDELYREVTNRCVNLSVKKRIWLALLNSRLIYILVGIT